MTYCFNSLTTVNIELTSRCNKNCWMCGRRKIDKEFPELKLDYGDMPFELLQKISLELPENIVLQFHNNGEPLLYKEFREAMQLFTKQIRCMDTNGKLLIERAKDIIGNLETLTVSTFENDEDADEQYTIIKQFLKVKGHNKPNIIIRCLGNVDIIKYKELACIIAKRVLHSPMGSFEYKKEPTLPEIGICLDLLNHMVINRKGKVSMCVRFDPDGLGVIGDLNETPLIEIWNGQERKKRIALHIEGKRKLVPLCSDCDYWGIPTGY